MRCFLMQCCGDFLAGDAKDLQVHHPFGILPVSCLHLPNSIWYRVNPSNCLDEKGGSQDARDDFFIETQS